MKIKSLLLGSAAAMFAVSGASAADAVVAAAPEPVEYVRVCDAFGTGYFYIPGTETCLRISGYVRFQVGSNDRDADTQGDTWTNLSRGRVQVDTRSDSEWGEVATRARLQATSSLNSDPDVTLDQAWLRVGGLFMGWAPSYWVDAYNTGASNYGAISDNGLAYGYQKRHLVGYTFNSGTFFFSASMENDRTGNVLVDDWTPDFTAKAGAVFGGATFWIKAAYDDSVESVLNTVTTYTDVWSAGAGAAFDLGPGDVRILGFWADGPTAYGANLSFAPTVGSAGATWTPEWSVIAAYGMDLGATLYGSIQGQYFWNFYAPTYLDSGHANTGVDAWTIEGSLVWTPISNFEIRTEVTYTDVDTLGSQTQGYLRFQRSF